MVVDVKYAIKQFLIRLHEYYLKNNEYDEGDLIFYRINYKLMDTFRMTKADAEQHHKIYHNENPRRISEGYCDDCRKITTIIPIIYGVVEKDLATLKEVQNDGRLIVGNIDAVKEGDKVAMFGCKICKNPLPKYGTM